ncbi:MAG: T9SS type A sorting domain-containing protein [Bacteroidia bacterium]
MRTNWKIIFIMQVIIICSLKGWGQISCVDCCPTCIGLPSPGGCTWEAYESINPTPVCPSGLPYILVFDDEFTGDAIDLSRWVTCSASNTVDQYGNHGGAEWMQDYDNGRNYIFNHPGVTLVDSAVTPFRALGATYADSNSTLQNGWNNYTTWSFTSSNLYSGYKFPSTGQNEGLNGIYVLTCTLPRNYNSYANGTDPYTNSNNYSQMWPAFWMWGNDTVGHYGELDGFEFPNVAFQDFQTVHAPTDTNSCGIVADPGVTDFGDGVQRTYSIIYSPNEDDWFIDNIETRQNVKYYYSLTSSWEDFYPYTCNNQPNPSDIDLLIQNFNIPQVAMTLQVTNNVQFGASPSFFPIHFDIQSVKYYEPLPCSGTTIVDNSMVENTRTNNPYNTFNVFTGDTVILKCDSIPGAGFNGSNASGLNIPLHKYPYAAPNLGQLKLIGANKIVIKGGFNSSGYFVAKTDNNLCNEYSGPQPSPYAPPHHIAIKDSTSKPSKKTSTDSLNCFIKQSATRGQFAVGLDNISPDELNQIANVTVYTMLGQIIFTGSLAVEENSEITIDLSAYARGVYAVIIRTKNKIVSKKVVLQ